MLSTSAASPPMTLDEGGEIWREELGAAFAYLAPERLELAERLAATTPLGRLIGADLGPLLAYEVTGTPQIVRRTSLAVRRAPIDLLKICVQVRGRAVVHQDGREVVIEPGQMAIYDTALPYDLRLEDQWNCAVMAFPRDALGLPKHVLSSVLMTAFRLDSGPGAVLAGFVSSTVLHRDSMRDAAAQRLGEAGLHLLAGTLSEVADPEGDVAADAQRIQVLAYVRAHLTNPDLTHASVAVAHHMSARTLSRLFERESLTVTDYIRSQRLAGARRDLTNPLLAGRSIAAIAARWCFPDQANFTRAFRAAFGITPSAARAIQ